MSSVKISTEADTTAVTNTTPSGEKGIEKAKIGLIRLIRPTGIGTQW